MEDTVISWSGGFGDLIVFVSDFDVGATIFIDEVQYQQMFP